MQAKESIDLGLHVCSVLRRVERLTHEEIAAYTDCSAVRIRQIEEAALKKVRRLLKLQGISGDLAEALRG